MKARYVLPDGTVYEVTITPEAQPVEETEE
jgi:hypothetical protein